MAPASSSPSPSSRSSSSKYKLVATVASEAMGIGKSSDVLTVLGGKASCRRKFVLNLHLMDEHGNLAAQDMSVVASVAYAHDHTLVVRDDKQFLAEPPLFTTFNGVEFPAQDRPTRMVSGRASFKLALSLLSSKCDNRLFCICFTPQPDGGVEPCYSKPIRSISRKRTQSAPPPAVTIPPSISCEEEALGHKITSSPGSSSENGGGGGGEYSTPRRYSSRRGAAAAASDTVPVHGVSNTMVVENTLKNSFCSVEKSSSLSLSMSPTSESGSPSSVVDNKLPELLEAGVQQQSPARSNNTESELLPRPGQTRAFRPYARVPAAAAAAAMLTSEFSTFARSAATEALTQSSIQHLAPGLNQIMTTTKSAQQQQQNASTNKTEPSLEEEEKSLQYIEVSLQEVHRELQRRKEELVNKKRRLLEDDTRMHSIIFQSSSWIESLRGRFSL